MKKPQQIIVAGGGAAGFFAAIHAKLIHPGAAVIILEKSREVLAKVAISGGGRCNVTHECYDPRELITRYPRGGKELLGPFHRFQPADTIEWFESRGVPIKTESDGRMFPVSDDSADILQALQREASRLGVEVRTRQGLLGAEAHSKGFRVQTPGSESLLCDALILATGGNRASGGWAIAEQMGHSIVEPVPSLFSFHVKDPILEGLAGVSVDPVTVSIPEMGAEQEGPLLITHKGVSGPAILKLSAWQARELAERKDHVEFVVNWLPQVHHLREHLKSYRRESGAKLVVSTKAFSLPRRLWERLCQQADISSRLTWAQLTSVQERTLEKLLQASPFLMRGKTLNKEEFVTCGGVDLKEVDMKTFRSKFHPNLYFAGEVLNIDGVTGGFNFQAAWTGGYLAGTHAGESLASKRP